MSRTPLLDRCTSEEARADLEDLILQWTAVFNTAHDAWRSQAACAGVDMHFPGRGQSDRANAAKAICATCPVKAECLDYALTHSIEQGVWGGTTEKERRALAAAAAQT